jgi:SAM-dependent methyltransferase
MMSAAQNATTDQRAARVGAALFSPKAPDFRTAAVRQRNGLALGDFASVGWMQRTVTRSLNDAAELRAVESALDVCAVVTDETPRLGAIPDDAFDVVTSAFSVQFAADAEAAALELVRVCRPGGRISIACWTAEGFIAQVAAVLRRYAPDNAEANAPALWGTRRHLNSFFGHHAAALGARDCSYTFRYPSAESWLANWRTGDGPLRSAFRAVDPDWREQLADDLLAIAVRFNRSADERIVIPADYLSFLVHKKVLRVQ